MGLYDVFQFDAYSNQYTYIGTGTGQTGPDAAVKIRLRNCITGCAYYRPAQQKPRSIPAAFAHDLKPER